MYTHKMIIKQLLLIQTIHMYILYVHLVINCILSIYIYIYLYTQLKHTLTLVQVLKHDYFTVIFRET